MQSHSWLISVNEALATLLRTTNLEKITVNNSIFYTYFELKIFDINYVWKFFDKN